MSASDHRVGKIERGNGRDDQTTPSPFSNKVIRFENYTIINCNSSPLFDVRVLAVLVSPFAVVVAAALAVAVVSLWRAFTALGFPACKNGVLEVRRGEGRKQQPLGCLHAVVIVNHPCSKVVQ